MLAPRLAALSMSASVRARLSAASSLACVCTRPTLTTLCVAGCTMASMAPRAPAASTAGARLPLPFAGFVALRVAIAAATAPSASGFRLQRCGAWHAAQRPSAGGAQLLAMRRDPSRDGALLAAAAVALYLPLQPLLAGVAGVAGV